MKRLTPAALTLSMFGVVGLLVVAYIAKSLLAVEEKKSEPALRNIPMAIADIEPGTVITETHLGQGPFPVDKLGRDTLLVNRVVVGRVAKEPIKAAQPIRANQLYKPGELPPLNIGEDMRAVSIEIGESVGMVDGMIKPGQFVDVLFTYGGSSDDRFQGGVTMRLFEGVRLIAVNRNTSQGRLDRTGNRVTLELTESQTNVIVLAKDRGTITLSFNPHGKGKGGLALSNADRVTLHEILGLMPAEPAQEPFVTETFKGPNHAIIEFNAKGQRIQRDRGIGTDRNNPQSVLPKLPPGTSRSPNDPGNPYDDNPAPSVERAVPGPQDTPVRRSPTASRLGPIPN